MPEVIFTGPAGRIEGRYHPARQKNAPIGIVLHPHPQFGGTMNHQIVYQLYYAFVHRGFSALRFNFRGVGRSQGGFDHGIGELSDAAAALDWAQSYNPEARSCWIAGFSFGSWIGMQLLMRRSEIQGFISIAPPAHLHDFSFLDPCPAARPWASSSTATRTQWYRPRMSAVWSISSRPRRASSSIRRSSRAPT